MKQASTTRLTAGQIFGLALLGVVLWFTAAMLLRALIPMGALEGGARALTYALIIPGTAPFVWLIAYLAKLPRALVAPGVALVTGTAALCDGIALAWFPALYAADAAGAQLAGAAILWGAGVGIVLGFLLAGKVGRDG